MCDSANRNPLSVGSLAAQTDRGCAGRLPLRNEVDSSRVDGLSPSRHEGNGCLNSVNVPLPYEEDYSKAVEAVDRAIERYSLQSAARALLPDSRTAWCLRRRRAGHTEVEVYQSISHRGTFYGKLATCNHLWTCPICAAKISERRRVELMELVDAHKAAGGQVAFVTLTFSHSQAEFLIDILPKLSKALKAFKSGRAAKAIREYFNLAGTVRALEVTHGEENGWHVHVHELWFLNGKNHYLAPAKDDGTQAALSGFEAVSLEEHLYPLWRSACLRAGLGEPSKLRGLTVQGGDYAAQYAGKWGMENEMTKSHVKKGRGDRHTPWDFLRLFRDGDEGDRARASELFREYAAAFKGQRQLVFSKGLKALYKVEDLSDDEIAEKHEDDARLLGKLTVEQWRRVLREKSSGRADARAELLKRARFFGWEGVIAYLAELGALSREEAADACREYLADRGLTS